MATAVQLKHATSMVDELRQLKDPKDSNQKLYTKNKLSEVLGYSGANGARDLKSFLEGRSHKWNDKYEKLKLEYAAAASKVTVLYWNHGKSTHLGSGTRSSRDKVHHVMGDLIKDKHPSVVVVAELQSEEAQCAIEAYGYKFVNGNDEVAIFVSKSLRAQKRRRMSRWATVKVTAGNKNFYIVGVHAERDASVTAGELEVLRQVVANDANEGKEYMLIGDFNCHPGEAYGFAENTIAKYRHDSRFPEKSEIDFAVVSEGLSARVEYRFTHALECRWNRDKSRITDLSHPSIFVKASIGTRVGSPASVVVKDPIPQQKKLLMQVIKKIHAKIDDDDDDDEDEDEDGVSVAAEWIKRKLDGLSSALNDVQVIDEALRTRVE